MGNDQQDGKRILRGAGPALLGGLCLAGCLAGPVIGGLIVGAVSGAFVAPVIAVAASALVGVALYALHRRRGRAVAACGCGGPCGHTDGA